MIMNDMIRRYEMVVGNQLFRGSFLFVSQSLSGNVVYLFRLKCKNLNISFRIFVSVNRRSILCICEEAGLDFRTEAVF